jgi:hypothetical protein
MKLLNKELIESNIRESVEELQGLIARLATQNEEDLQEDLRVGLEHAMHHLAYAWNARNMTYEETDEAPFETLCRFPSEFSHFAWYL